MKTFKLALSFLTRLPIGQLGEISDHHWPKSMIFFPLCGMILSLLIFSPVIFLLEYTKLSPLVAAGLTTTLLLYWSGALHIDGFADCCDGLGCPADPEKRKVIMKDPTIGSFAAAGLIALLILKTAAIAQLLNNRSFFALLFIPAMARFIPVLLSCIGKYPNPSGIGKFTIGVVNKPIVVIAFITILPAFIWPVNIASFLVMLSISMLLKRKSDQLIGGITGDVLGATIELSETVGFLTLCLFN